MLVLLLRVFSVMLQQLGTRVKLPSSMVLMAKRRVRRRNRSRTTSSRTSARVQLLPLVVLILFHDDGTHDYSNTYRYNTKKSAVVHGLDVPMRSFKSSGRVAPFEIPPYFPTTNTHAGGSIASQCACGSVTVQFPIPNIHQQQQNQHQYQQQYQNNNNCQVPNNSNENDFDVIDCHCPSCRRFHVTSFVRYLYIPGNDVLVSGDTSIRYQDTCHELGNVVRTYCRQCYSKVLTTTAAPSIDDVTMHTTLPRLGQEMVLVNMGCIDSRTVPDEIVEHWRRKEIVHWQERTAPAWTYGLPNYVLGAKRKALEQQEKLKELGIGASGNAVLDDDVPLPGQITFRRGQYGTVRGGGIPPTTVSVTGGCTCGACTYKFTIESPTEFQHCYCSVCRQVSGGPCQTWIPVATHAQDFGWYTQGSVTNRNYMTQQRASVPDGRRRDASSHISTSDVPLVRYTNHAQRHACDQCGGVLSIIYDEDNVNDPANGTVLWIAAGSLDSIRFPSSHVDRYLERVVHICTGYKQSWYTLPNDGMPCIMEAS